MDKVKIIECPRDAWQGIEKIIPAEIKAQYLSKLAELGFRHLDAVSFVAPKYVPQMADSEDVLARLERAGVIHVKPNGAAPAPRISSLESRIPTPEIIAIVINEKGLERALKAPGVETVGYPYSISANFRRQNANMSLSESRALVHTLQRETAAAGRNLIIYISMAFGNPFEEPWGPEIVIETLEWLAQMGVRQVSLADTVGLATANEVGDLYKHVRKTFSEVEVGLHLHSRPEGASEKVMAGYEAGCRRFDAALTGLGGCPFAGDDLVGNIATETVVKVLSERGATIDLEPWALLAAVDATQQIRKRFGK